MRSKRSQTRNTGGTPGLVEFTTALGCIVEEEVKTDEYGTSNGTVSPVPHAQLLFSHLLYHVWPAPAVGGCSQRSTAEDNTGGAAGPACCAGSREASNDSAVI